MANRKSFIIHIDSLEILNDMSEIEAGRLFKAIYAFQSGENVALDPVTKMAFIPFKNQFKRDDQAYQKTAERNKINGSKGGKPKRTQSNPTKPSGLSGLQNNPVAPDSKSDNDNDSKSKNTKGVCGEIVELFDKDSPNYKPPEEIKIFRRPTEQQVADYFNEIGVDPAQGKIYMNHYNSNGWMVGKTKMKDWQAACRNWKTRIEERKKINGNGKSESKIDRNIAAGIGAGERLAADYGTGN